MLATTFITKRDSNLKNCYVLFYKDMYFIQNQDSQQQGMYGMISRRHA